MFQANDPGVALARRRDRAFLGVLKGAASEGRLATADRRRDIEDDGGDLTFANREGLSSLCVTM